MPQSQPMQVFHSEVTSINHLYWVTSYCYSRVSDLFEAQTRHRVEDPDPKINHIWPSGNAGEQRQTGVKLSKFGEMQSGNLKTLRRTSVLYACSSFENYLSNTYILLGLYQPLVLDTSWSHGPVPQLLSDTVNYTALKELAAKKASGMSHLGGRLKGKYPSRVARLCSDFGLALPALDDAALNRYYELRHLIAHDQGIEDADNPDESPECVIARRVDLAEAEWEQMIACFMETSNALDTLAISKLPLNGAHIAAASFLAANGRPKLSALRAELYEKWGMTFTYDVLESIIKDLGFKAHGNNRLSDRKVF